MYVTNSQGLLLHMPGWELRLRASNTVKVWKTNDIVIVLTFAIDQQAMIMRAPRPIGTGTTYWNLQWDFASGWVRSLGGEGLFSLQWDTVM